MNIRFSFPALLAVGMFALGASQVHAAMNGDLVLVVDRDTGNMSLTGASSTMVNLAGYAISSGRGSIATGSFNGLSDTETDWVSAGIPSANGIQELISNPSTVSLVDDTVTLDLGTPAYNRAAAIADAGFGANFEQGDLSMTFYDTLDNAVYSGAVSYIGDELLNNIGIIVDLADGTATLTNDSTFNWFLTGYLIEAATDDTLNTNLGTFNGLRNETGGGNFQAPATLDGENLGELDPTGVGIALNAGQSYSLGVIDGVNNDLSFSFILAGIGEVTRTGFVTYLNAGLAGDFNGDGRVDAADYTVWRDNLGATDESAINFNGDGGDISGSDYTLWRDNFGNFAAPAALAGDAGAVPEPTAMLLAFAALSTIGLVCRRNHVE